MPDDKTLSRNQPLSYKSKMISMLMKEDWLITIISTIFQAWLTIHAALKDVLHFPYVITDA
jgi:hypothetical protein